MSLPPIQTNGVPLAAAMQGTVPGRLRRAGRDVRRLGERKAGPALMLLAALWIVLLFDPHWYLVRFLGQAILKLPVLLFGPLLLVLVFGIPGDAKAKARWQWHAPFLMFILVGIASFPFALNKGYVQMIVQGQLLFWALITASVALIDSGRRAELLVKLYGIQFVWWGLFGAQTGLVYWHHSFANYDGFGAFAVGGLGMCYFLWLASPPSWFRRAMMLAAVLSVLGVVASFARGAFLAAIAVGIVIVARSPKKGQTIAAGLAAALLVVVGASVLHPENSFWDEIKSAFEEGTTEGTGEDRWVLWQAAIKVFLANPIIGAGPKNWGVWAAHNFKPGDVGGMYADNPGRLYDHNLHSFYFQTLSELGTLGIIALIWILRDFWKRNAALRTEAAERKWAEMGCTLKLRPVALGIEACLIAFLVTASLYALSGIHWFFTIVGLNLVLHSVVVGKKRPRRRVWNQAPPGAGAVPQPEPTSTPVLHVPVG